MSAVWAFFKRDYLWWSSYRINFVWQPISVLAMLLTVYFVGQAIGGGVNGDPKRALTYVPFVLSGIAFTEIFMTGLGVHSAFREAQMSGTLEPLLVAPIRLFQLILASSLFRYAYSLVRISLIVVIAVTLLGYWRHANLLTAVIVLIPGCLAFVSVGLLATSLVIVFKRGDPLVGAFAAANGVLGGIFFPISVLPGWMHFFVFFLPLSHALSGMRLALDGAAPSAVTTQVAVLSAATVVLMPLAVLSLNWALTRAKKEGSLVEY